MITKQSSNILRIAVVQPHTFSPTIFAGGARSDDSEERKNLETCEAFVSQAAKQGANLIFFPENYPGPTSESTDLTFDEVVEEMGRQARTYDVTISYGGVRRLDPENIHVLHNLATPDGELFTYKKMIPATLEHETVPGTEPVVVDLGNVKIGLAICWEAWFPEIARALTFGGAEIILFPTGSPIYELHDVWTSILQARAAENVAYVASTVPLVGAEDGMAYIFGPEGPEGSLLREGMIVADLDLDLLRELRSVDQVFSFPFPYRTIPGTLRSLHPHVVSAYVEAAGVRSAIGD